jgi:DNA polymerase I-like protein with 3'-5' exonuclease and polymerase domains
LLGEQTLVVADYSSLEVGIQGDFCSRLFGDNQILEMYAKQESEKLDIHCLTAREVFGRWLKWTVPDYVTVEGKPVKCSLAGKTADHIPTEEFKAHPYGAILRDLIKAVRYGMAYGKTDYGFALLVGADGKMIGQQTARAMMDALFQAEPGQLKWMRWCEEFIREHGGIYSLDGRWCDLSHLMGGDEWAQRAAFRKGYNFPMQATGAGIMGEAMAALWRCPKFNRLGMKVCLQVHDELVARGPAKHTERATKLMVHHMKSATANGTKLLVDLQVGVGAGYNYFEAK